MTMTLLLLAWAACGCSACGGNGTTDSSVDDWDGHEPTEDSLDVGDRDSSPDPDLHDPTIEDPVEATTDAVDQLPADCFSELDAPAYAIAPVWATVELGGEPTACEGCCRQVTFAPFDVRSYDVWGNFIIYRAVNSEIEQVRLKDILDTTEYIVREVSDLSTLLTNIAIYMDTFMYIHDYFSSETGVECNIYRGNIVTGETTIVHTIDMPTTTADGYWCPGKVSPMDLDGSHLVYESNRTGLPAGQQVYLLDVETGGERMISIGPGAVGFPRIWKNRVVYYGWYEGNPEVYLYDIETGLTENLTYRDGEFTAEDLPSIWENLVVFRQGPTEGDKDFFGDIYMMDIGVRDFVPVCTNPATVYGPIDIFWDLVAWIDYRNDPCPNYECRETNTDIYYYRLSTGQEHRGVSNTGIEASPRIWGNRVYFRMRDSSGIVNVFMIEAQ